MSTPKERIQKLNEILEILKANNGRMPFKKLYGKLALKYGTTENTMWNYLEALKAAEEIDYSAMVRIGQDFEVWLANKGESEK